MKILERRVATATFLKLAVLVAGLLTAGGIVGCTATLYSPSVHVGASSGDTVYCNVLNVSSSPRTGTIQIVQLGVGPLSTVSYNSVAPESGTGDSVSSFAANPPVATVYCKLTVDGSRRSIRGAFGVRGANGTSIVSTELR